MGRDGVKLEEHSKRRKRVTTTILGGTCTRSKKEVQVKKLQLERPGIKAQETRRKREVVTGNGTGRASQQMLVSGLSTLIIHQLGSTRLVTREKLIKFSAQHWEQRWALGKQLLSNFPYKLKLGRWFLYSGDNARKSIISVAWKTCSVENLYRGKLVSQTQTISLSVFSAEWNV